MYLEIQMVRIVIECVRIRSERQQSIEQFIKEWRVAKA